MDIDKLTRGQLKELQKVLGIATNEKGQPYQIGKAYLIRTVTFIQIGIVQEVTDQEIILSDASWIADTGRFYDALSKGVSILKEVEPFPSDVIVGRGTVVDATLWTHSLPGDQK